VSVTCPSLVHEDVGFVLLTETPTTAGSLKVFEYVLVHPDTSLTLNSYVPGDMLFSVNVLVKLVHVPPSH
jgi:hypothetical protein